MRPAGDERFRAERFDSRSDMQALHEELMQSLPELVFTCRPDGTCDFMNRRWLEYTGIGAEAQQGHDWLLHVHPEDRAPIGSAWEVALHELRDFRSELRLLRRDQSFRHFDARVMPVRDAAGRVRMWIGQLIDVQESWEIRERLREKTDQLEKLVAAVPAVICTYELRPDGSACFPYASPKTRDVFGLEPEQLAQDSACLFDRIHEDDLGPLARGIQASGEQMSTWHGAFRYAHPTKGERYIEGYSQPTVTPDGRIAWHGIVSDVTQQRNEQLALQTTLQRSAARDRIGRVLLQARSVEEGLGQLLETLCQVETWQLGVLWLQGAPSEPLRCVARWCEPSLATPVLDNMFANAVPGAMIQPEEDADLLSLLARTGALALMNQAALASSSERRARLAGAHGLRSALFCPMDHGSSFRALLELYGTRERPSGSGSLELIEALGNQAFLCVERLNAENALRSSEQSMQSIIMNMSEGLVVSDAEGLLTLWNPAALELHGMSRREDWNKRMPEFIRTFELATMEGEVLPLEEWPMSRILRGQQLRGLALRVRRLDCDWQRVLGYGGGRVEQPNGRALAFLTISDLTERTRATEVLQRMNVELERRVAERTSQLMHSNRELESFSYSVSHDLRAPLRAMNGYAQMLLEDYAQDLPADARRLIDVIGDSGRHMGQLIDDLLALSRLGRKELRVAPVDMRALLDDILMRSNFPGQERSRVTIGELPGCTGDPSLLKQVWTNLLSNAFKYARGRDPIEVEIRGERANQDEVSYSVRDNGAGFDMRYVHKLFGVFQRLHTDDEFEGTGVGLAIVQSIVSRHGGRVWASAELDRGAIFGFSLPGGIGT